MSINRLLITVFAALIVLLVALFSSLSLLSYTQGKITDSEHRRYESYKLADELRQSSDDLTHMARLYAVTGDARFADYFHEILDIRKGKRPRPQDYDLVYWDLVGADGKRPRPFGEKSSLEDRMIAQGFSVVEFSKLRDAQNNSDTLALVEEVAMNAVNGRFDDGTGEFTRAGPPDMDLAKDLMFGERYLAAKARIMEPINDFFVLLDKRTRNEVAENRRQGEWLMLTSLIISFMTVTLSVAAIFVLRKKALRPLGLISAAAERVRAGDYDHQIRHDSRDEVGRLVSAFNGMVKSTKSSIAALQYANDALRESQEELQKEKSKSEELLLNVLPAAIADRLKQGETTIADEFPEVTVMFVDLVGFTELTDAVGPHQLVRLLNNIFELFDRRLEEFDLEKIKTIGDSYMVVGGLPEPVADHAQQMAEFAFAIREDFARLVATMDLDISVRLGIHSGTAVAGIVGTKRFAYDLWGDVVNVASRMESLGAPNKIHVSEPFMVRLRDMYEFVPHDEIEVKGKGRMQTYYLVGRRYQPTMVEAK